MERKGKKAKAPSFEIRTPQGELDEVVADHPKFFHLEYMDDGAVWMCVTTKEGKDLHINLWTKRNTKIHGRAEVQ